MLGSAILALMLLASNISNLTFQPGHFYTVSGPRLPAIQPGAQLPVDPSTIGFWQTILAFISMVLLLCLLIALILSAKLRRELLRRIITALVGVLLIYFMISLLRRMPRVAQGDLTTSAPAAQPGLGEPFPTFVAQPPPWLVIAISLLLAALLIGAIWFVWRRSRPPQSPLAQLADEAQAALDELQAGGDMADAVLRCYREMSRVLSEQRGVARARDATAREFERQLAAAGLRDEHIQQLTRLFERVRYGPRQASAREELEAADCLRAIVRAYGAAP